MRSSDPAHTAQLEGTWNPLAVSNISVNNYKPYKYPAQNYSGTSTTCSGGQDNSWAENSHGPDRETTSRAAEVLRNMSNTNYMPNTTAAVSHPGFTATNSATTNAGRNMAATYQAQDVQLPQHNYATHAAYGRYQERPHSVNTNHASVAAPSRGLSSPTMAAGYSDRNIGVPTSYSYADRQVPAHIMQSTPTGPVAEQYSQNTTTVDPMAVYDPWPEYQRKQEALQAQKAIEEAARAEQERKAEAIQLEEQRKIGEERRILEKEERVRNYVPIALPASQPILKEAQTSENVQKQQGTATEATLSEPESSDESAAKLAAEIRTMMAKMRELNGKDAALLARIWEEERRSKVPRTPTMQAKPAPQSEVAQPVHTSVTQTVNQRKKAVVKEASNTASTGALAVVAAQSAVSKSQAQAVASSARPIGNTIWPPEKKSQLANAAAKYLNKLNPYKPIDTNKVLSMLDSNPSYIELCEQLEHTGRRLDRAAFAKNLLTAVPDVNSKARHAAPGLQPNGALTQRVQAPPAIPAKKVATQGAPNPRYSSVVSPMDQGSFPPFPDKNASAASHSPVIIAETVPIRAALKPTSTKEEAARKRTFNDLIDLTLLDEEEDNQPPLKKQNVNSMYSTHDSPGLMLDDMNIDEARPPMNNFPVPAGIPQVTPVSAPAPPSAPSALRHTDLVQPLDKHKALRRNTYNIKTIARDVLLACGRHPDERQLNAHLDLLRTNLPQINSDADLSTIRWDLIDPGEPPRGYFKLGVQGAEAEEADDESTDNEDAGARTHAPAQAIGGEGAAEARVEASNPFKPKRRGRPPRHSYPFNSTTVKTPRSASLDSRPSDMSASAPRPSAASVGYSAFRAATEYGPDGKPLPKKKGRPVGWRKAIHGSPTAQARLAANGHTGPLVNRPVPSKPSTLRNVKTGIDEPIMVHSRSPSIANNVPRYQSFKCKWQNCKAELHNFETLKRHVHKIHRKETLGGILKCLWGDCGKEVTSVEQKKNIFGQKHTRFTFNEDNKWREHLDNKHFSPMLWELGDGPASGLSGK
jgi:hypothetical protein